MRISRIAKPCFFGCTLATSTLATSALAADVTLTVEDVKTSNGAVRADSWQRVLRFLDAVLKPKG